MSVSTQTQPARKANKGIQEKWAVRGLFDGKITEFGPYDTSEKADKTLPVLTDAGLTKAEVVVIYTCSSVTEFARKHTPKSETSPVSPAPAKDEPKPAAPKGRGRGRQSAKG